MIPVFVQVSKFLTTTLGCLAIVSWFGASEAWAQNIRWSPSPPASPSNYPSTSNGGTYANPATNFPNSVRQNGNIATSDPRIAALPAPGSSSVGSNVTYSSGANPTATTAEASTGKIPTRNLLQVFHDGGWMMYPIAIMEDLQ